MGIIEEEQARYMSLARTVLDKAKSGCTDTLLSMKFRLSICKECSGDSCEKCGGAGLLKECREQDCLEYGCQGRGKCVPNKKDLSNIVKGIS